jgi:hypothetical protein
MLAHIYYLTCGHCGLIYVGSTRDPKGIMDRLYNHHTDMKYPERQSKLYVHMNEVGRDQFTIIIKESIDVQTDKERYQAEQRHIELANSIEMGLNSRAAFCSEERRRQQERVAILTQAEKRKNDPTFKPRYNEYRAALRAKPTKDAFRCETCGYATNRPDSLHRHNQGKRHQFLMSIAQIPQEVVQS